MEFIKSVTIATVIQLGLSFVKIDAKSSIKGVNINADRFLCILSITKTPYKHPLSLKPFTPFKPYALVPFIHLYNKKYDS